MFARFGDDLLINAQHIVSLEIDGMELELKMTDGRTHTVTFTAPMNGSVMESILEAADTAGDSGYMKIQRRAQWSAMTEGLTVTTIPAS